MGQRKATRLSGRDRAVLHLVDRLRVVTFTILMESILSGLTRSGVSKIVNRLVRSDYLCSYTLFHPTRYFVLGDQGARLLGRNNYRTLPLGPQALPIEYSAAVYCVLGRMARKRLMPEEVKELHPWLRDHAENGIYCIEQTTSVLESLRVDLGGPADHVARKCRADIDEYMMLPQFGRLVQSKQFRLVVVTATKDKAAAIKAAMKKHTWPKGLLFHSSVVSELLLLTARKSHA